MPNFTEFHQAQGKFIRSRYPFYRIPTTPRKTEKFIQSMLAILQNATNPKENSSDLSPILQNSTNPKEPQRKGSAADIETVDGIEYSEKLYIPQANRGKRTSGWSTTKPKYVFLYLQRMRHEMQVELKNAHEV
uniref:Uncharacterized protein n=1 Tax=Cacopsylla melanoneura TaxID=428564 RepID=A0A8D9AYY4_9HEMI